MLVIGDVVTDVVARHTAPLAVGTDTPAGIAILPGGAGANVAAWAAHCGARVRLLARAGRDSADWHRAALVRAGVDARVRVDPEAPTGKVVALVDGDGERSFLTDSGASSRLGPDDWEPGLLAGVTHVHLSGYLFFTAPGRALATLATAAAHARGATVSVDPASAGFLSASGVGAFLTAIADADTLFPNSAEAALLTGLPSPAAAAGALAASLGATAVVTAAADGAHLATPGVPAVHVPACPVTPLDSTGAGDAFAGAYLAAVQAGSAPRAAAAAGCATAATAVRTPGGRPGQGA
ncbi:PfkB family carbohydrate kinase [Streptomyces sp. WMMC500]|uniref:carbohydrate kinase family protein n=1 Tax=Streptomyces sp. WMMC500 TaxID=3015154 RepID=UPI00248AFAC2|nr:PfkB family carbohydrate kinase [Streptomyces sp. WMMC500]WBB64710.1 PfkB family carbohydrate kinase [Streptomyces sp. WMMC500]